MPTLAELSRLFSEVPYLPDPVPRRRTPFVAAGPIKPAHVQPAASTTPGTVSTEQRTHWSQRMVDLIRCCCTFLFGHRIKEATSPSPARKVNPFAVLKAGKKLVVIAAVDAGNISFFRFGEGAFEDFPMN